METRRRKLLQKQSKCSMPTSNVDSFIGDFENSIDQTNGETVVMGCNDNTDMTSSKYTRQKPNTVPVLQLNLLNRSKNELESNL